MAVKFDLSGAALPASRSSVGAAEDEINSLLMLFYENGVLLPELTVSKSVNGGSQTTVTATLDIGHDYEVAAFANCTVTDYPRTIGQARSMCYTCDGVGNWQDGIPMSACKIVHASYAMNHVPLKLVRLASRVDLHIDTSGLEHGSMTFSSIAVRQMNRCCPYFSSGVAATETGVCDGDLASASDLENINATGAGYRTSFYLLENLQGDILAGNGNPDLKTPEMVTAAGGNPALCTYLEISGTYSDRSGFLHSENVLAHMYLGSDAVSNFDLVRNSRYTVTLTITDRGCLRTDWKIDGNLDDSRVLRFTSDELRIGRDTFISVPLDTNLSLSGGDYSYSVTGDTEYFSVTPSAEGFSAHSSPTVSSGQSIVVTVTSWDGALSSSCTVRAEFQDGERFTVDWDNDLYVGQKGTIRILDNDRSLNPSRIVVRPVNDYARVEGSGYTWYVYALRPGSDVLTIYLGSSVYGYIRVDFVPPVMKMSADRIFLPLDGAEVECGPYFYRTDGTRLYESDFDPDLYESLICFDVERKHTFRQCGRYWREGGSEGNPVVSLRPGGGQSDPYLLRIDGLSSRGASIGENYDFSGGDVTLETITAVCRHPETYILDATAEVYTADPFGESRNLGREASWALAYWAGVARHEEVMDYSSSGIVLDGNDSDCAVVPDSQTPSGLEFSFPDRETLRMAVLYDTYGPEAMPPAELTLNPGMRNRVSGEVYESVNSLTLGCTVNVAVGGVAAAAGPSSTQVSVEWSFPRCASMASLEDIVASDVNGTVRGMYTPLYTRSGSPESVMASTYPTYYFCRTANDASGQGVISDDYYQIPPSATPGYRIRVWKYSRMMPQTKGWL
ncbi:MAG: DUF4906 domain-containing protein [Bacteroidales bacterium]|nr:DUF4906 domain-containing protein [Bacteroidales bacterium]